MNERSPSKMLQSQSEAFLGLLKAAPYLITLLSNVVLQSIFHALRNNEIQGGGEHSNHTWRETNRTGDYTRNPLNWIKQLYEACFLNKRSASKYRVIADDLLESGMFV